MRNNKYQIGFAMLVTLLLTVNLSGILAQNKNATGAKKQNFTLVDATVTNEEGKAIVNAVITAGEGALVYYTDKSGKFNVRVKSGSAIVIEANGYESKIFETGRSANEKVTITLSKVSLFAGAKDTYYLPGMIQNVSRYNIGAVSSVKGTAIESYSDMITANALQGKLLGLMSLANVGGLSNNVSSLYIRGLHREGGNGIVTLVDGVERDINTLIPEEIESISVLKDASSKILYGPRAANGVLSIVTKRGEIHKRIIKVNAEYGVGLPAAMPKFIGSYDYTRLYNEARQNDGLAPLYSDAEIEGYRNSTGENDFRYPNVDFYNYFLRKNTEYRKVDFEFSGGNDNAQYYFVAGYNGNSGLQKVGETPQRNRYNVRGNLDMKVNDYISSFIGLAGVFDITNRSSLDHAQTFNALSTHRPNEYPFLIPDSILTPDAEGYPNVGAGLNQINNLYGSLLYGGYVKDQSINGQLNFGLNFDLNKVTKGLTAKAQITFDNYFWGSEGISTAAPAFSQRWVQTPDGRDSVILIQRRMGNKNDNLNLRNSITLRTTTMQGSVNYNNKVGDAGKLSADYVYNYFISEVTGISQDVKFINNVIRTNYVNSDKYIAEASLAYMGSNKFINKNQFTSSFSAGLGWIISEESFLSDNQQIDYLKAKASFGVLAYDGQTSYNLYRDRWNDNGTVRINNELTPARTNFDQIGNPDLKWEKSREFNIGLEALLLNKKLWVEANYFNELRYDIIQKLDSRYSAMFGGLFPYSNWGEVSNSGFEIEIKYADRVGNVFYQFGGNLIFSKNKVLKTNEIDYPDDYLKIIGKSSDAMFGYVATGLFGKDVELATATPQSFGAYQVGDIAYEDLNNDDVIDELDSRMLSNSFPRTHLGVDLNLNYKGFGLYVLGTAQLGYSNWLNNSYFWNKAEDKYSDITLDRYHPTANPSGTYPRLTTTNGSNNFRNSSFWLQSGDFFRLKNIEISYTIIPKTMEVARKVKFFARGNNLLQISEVNNLDPEAMNAGLTNYPVLKNITGGVSVTF